MRRQDGRSTGLNWGISAHQLLLPGLWGWVVSPDLVQLGHLGPAAFGQRSPGDEYPTTCPEVQTGKYDLGQVTSLL